MDNGYLHSMHVLAQPRPEKRSTRRFSLDLPISVKFLDNGRQELAAHTRDVSSRGVFMYGDTEMTAGAAIEFGRTLAPGTKLSDPIRVRLTGRVRRRGTHMPPQQPQRERGRAWTFAGHRRQRH